ncbi:hypothetical protein E1189_02915 [Sansalvadorimonas verongulae]|nr:hypothetical protein [Sansalvadorimonas verongulae]
MPMGINFPGTVESDAERVTETFSFQLNPRDLSPLRMQYPPRHQVSTGLYRVPGEPVTIELRSLSAESSDIKPELRIGAHALDLNNFHPSYKKKRIGYTSDLFPLREGVLQDRKWASGLIYIESDQNGSDTFDITISGAVKAPWFKLGRDTAEQWRQYIRDYPAPWAELEGQYSVLTLPSALVRDLEDPTPVIHFYDQVVKRAHALAGLNDNADDERDKAPDRLYRFVMDVQLTQENPIAISNNYGVMLRWLGFDNPFRWIDPNDSVVFDLLLHEIGHALEPVDHLFELPGSSQVFADLFIYGDHYRKGDWFLGRRINVAGLTMPYDDSSYGNILSFVWLFASFIENYNYGYDPYIWSESPEVMVSWKGAFMVELVRHLSDAFIPELYHRFRHTPEHLLPDKDNQQEKTDFFFEMLCEVTGEDLTLIFRRWYVPVSEEAYQRVAGKGYSYPHRLYHDGL